METRKSFFALTGTVAAILATNLAFADSHNAGTTTCADLQFSQQILDVLPEANSACLGVVEQNGELYAEFQAEIVRYRAGEVRAKFKKADGGFTPIHAFRPDRDDEINIGGRSYKYSQLIGGQRINILLPPDRFQVAIADDDDHTAPQVTAVVVAVAYRPEPEMAALPATAGILPLIGLLGGLLTALGAGMVLIRRKLTV